jgi:hypothetical protein
MQTGTSASQDYQTPFAFTGTLDRVVGDLTPGPDTGSAEARSAEDDAKAKRAAVAE